jgi:magnesium-dependent phosphatase 1
MTISRLPTLVAFDLDYTLWPLWIDTHASSPLKREGNKTNEVVDRYGEVISFYPDVPQLLHRLKAEGVIIAAASRTSAPELAREALALLLMRPPTGSESTKTTRAIDMFDQLEIYPGSKIPHFKQLYKKTGIPYSEMLFFDDEPRNREVEKLGVTFHLIPKGVDNKQFEKGVAEWRRRHPQDPDEPISPPPKELPTF